MRYVWKNSKSKANARLMLLAIADIANDNGDAYPGVDKLAIKCNASHRCAQDVIQELERLSELQVYENVGTKTLSGWTNLYRIVLEGIEQGIVRNPKGEPASPRAIIEKKSRLFPKAMQLVAPLQDVQTVAPLDNQAMQLAAPDDVQLAAPNPPVYPPVINTNTSVASTELSVFESVAKYIFDITDFTGLDKSVKARFGLITKTAKELVRSRIPDATDERISQLVSNFAAAEKFKAGIQGTTGFQLKFAAYLEKKQNATPASVNPAHVPFAIEEITDAVDMPQEAKDALNKLKQKMLVSDEALYGKRTATNAA